MTATTVPGLPPLTLQPARPQATQDSQPYHHWGEDPNQPWTLFYRVDEGYLVRFPDVVDFMIDAAGQSIVAWPVPDATPDTVEHFFINQCQPLARSLQGRLTLHGSAVDIGGQVVAFLGHSGQGKSTLAASFAQHGHPFLTDDGVYIDFDSASGQCLVHPGHPSLRLWQDSEQALALTAQPHGSAVDHTPKARILAGEALRHAQAPRPLAAIYLLSDQVPSQPVVTPLGPVQALHAVSAQAFQLDTTDRQRLASHFDQLSRLADRVPCFTLDYARHYEALPGVRQAVTQHLRSLLQTEATLNP